MKALRTLAVFCLALVLATSAAKAGITDWWKTDSPEKSKTRSKSKSSSKKPFSGSKSAKGSSKLKMPDVVGTVSSGTKKAYNNTKSLLTPGKKKSTPHKITGSQTKSRATKKETTESTSTFGSLFASKKEPDPPKSIQEWMSLPRLDP
jgi:hypothetical protein